MNVSDEKVMEMRRNTEASHCPGTTPWVFVDAALIAAQIASLRAGCLHEAKHGPALHISIIWVLFADCDVLVKVTATVVLPFPAELARILASSWIPPLWEPCLLF